LVCEMRRLRGQGLEIGTEDCVKEMGRYAKMRW
jgi:hypothetical protein